VSRERFHETQGDLLEPSRGIAEAASGARGTEFDEGLLGLSRSRSGSPDFGISPQVKDCEHDHHFV
jgi:hypothetical protein